MGEKCVHLSGAAGYRALSRRRYFVERLESRLLLAVTITPEPSGGVVGPAGHVVEFRKANAAVATITDLASADKLFSVPVHDPTVGADATDNGVSVINYLDSGFGTMFPNPRDVGSSTLHPTFGAFFDHLEDDNFAMQSGGYLYLPAAGTYTFLVRSADGERLVMGASNLTVLQSDVIRLPTTDGVQVFAPSSGYYHYQLTWFQHTGGAMCELSAYSDSQPTELLVGDPGSQIKVYQSYDEPLSISGIGKTVAEGFAFNAMPVASITDPDPGIQNDYHATIDWGDGTPPDTSAQVVPPTAPGGQAQVLGSHSYADEGAFSIRVTVADTDGATSVGHGTWNVTESDGLAPSSFITFPFVPGQQFSGRVATFSVPRSPVSDFVAAINWGDGMPTSEGVLTVDPSAGLMVSGSHTYGASGSFAVTVTLSDDAPGTATATAHSTAVAETLSGTVPPSLVPEEQNFSGTVATFTDSYAARLPGELSATIDWGDGTAVTAGTVTGTNGSFTVSGAHTYGDEGLFPLKVTLSVNGSGGATGTATGGITASDADILSSQPLTVSPTEGQAFTGTVAAFTDTNSAATPGDFAATISWGDGGASTNGIVTSANGVFSVSGTHTYLSAGTFPISTSLQDSGGTAIGLADNTATVGVAPIVVGARFNYDQRPPSVQISFNEHVSVDQTALTVTNLGTGATVPVAGFQYVSIGNSAYFQFAGPLADGNYRATLAAPAVTDAGGKHLAADYTLDFFSLAGDINRDRKVDFSDLVILARHYGMFGTYAQGDLNGDAKIDFTDLVILARSYGHSVPAIPALASADDIVLKGRALRRTLTQ